MYKLFSRIQDWINSRLEYPDNIKDLAACCQKIYDQILAIDWVQLNTKPVNTKISNTSTRFIPPTRFVPPSSQTTSSNTNCYYSKPENTFFPFTNKKRLKLM